MTAPACKCGCGISTKLVAKGDPNLSSAETGAALSEKLTDIVARFAVHFASRVPA